MSGRGEKLRGIAQRLSALLAERFGAPAPFTLEATLNWLPSVPDQTRYAAVWSELEAVYAALLDDRWTLAARLAEQANVLRFGPMRVDAYFDTPYHFIFEFDEQQHFNIHRLRTLDAASFYNRCAFDVDAYRTICRAQPFSVGETSFFKLKSCDPLFPPLFEGAAQDNRTRQRAFRDVLKDLAPQAWPHLNPTLRVSWQVTHGKRGYFDERDIDAVVQHLLDNRFLDGMVLRE